MRKLNNIICEIYFFFLNKNIKKSFYANEVQNSYERIFLESPTKEYSSNNNTTHLPLNTLLEL